MSERDVKGALNAMTHWNHEIQFHITGGESFLNFPLLLYTVKVAAELGIPRYVETNAGWCVNEELVGKRFTALREAGLHAVLISCSPFHAVTIPLKRTLLAIQKAEEIFGPQGVVIYLPRWINLLVKFGLEDPIPLERYLQEYGIQGAGKLFWEGYGLISGGRSGYRLGQYANKYRATEFQRDHCKREILYAHHSHFDLYGNYISGFCGGLAIGSWRNLYQMLEDFITGRYPPLTSILIESGPYGLFELAVREYGYTHNEDGYVGKCHLCVDVRRHIVNREETPELKPEMFYRML
jgi:hypothetical protein